MECLLKQSRGRCGAVICCHHIIGVANERNHYMQFALMNYMVIGVTVHVCTLGSSANVAMAWEAITEMHIGDVNQHGFQSIYQHKVHPPPKKKRRSKIRETCMHAELAKTFHGFFFVKKEQRIFLIDMCYKKPHKNSHLLQKKMTCLKADRMVKHFVTTY